MSTTSRSDGGTAPSVTKIAKQSTAWASATPTWTTTTCIGMIRKSNAWRYRSARQAPGFPCYNAALAVKGYSSTPGITPHAVGLILSNLVRAGCVRVGRAALEKMRRRRSWWRLRCGGDSTCSIRASSSAHLPLVHEAAYKTLELVIRHELALSPLRIALRAGHRGVRTGSGQAAEEYGIAWRRAPGNGSPRFEETLRSSRIGFN